MRITNVNLTISLATITALDGDYAEIACYGESVSMSKSFKTDENNVPTPAIGFQAKLTDAVKVEFPEEERDAINYAQNKLEYNAYSVLFDMSSLNKIHVTDGAGDPYLTHDVEGEYKVVVDGQLVPFNINDIILNNAAKFVQVDDSGRTVLNPVVDEEITGVELNNVVLELNTYGKFEVVEFEYRADVPDNQRGYMSDGTMRAGKLLYKKVW